MSSTLTRPMAIPATGALIGTPASISDRRRRAHRRHRRRAVGRQHLRHQAQGVGELLDRGHDGQQGPLGQQAVADLPALRAADPPGLAVGVGRHVVVVHVALLVVDADGVEQLVHARHAEGGDVEHLGLAPLEQARAVGGGDDPDLGGHGTQVGAAAPVHADPGGGDPLADQLLGQRPDRSLDLPARGRGTRRRGRR